MKKLAPLLIILVLAVLAIVVFLLVPRQNEQVQDTQNRMFVTIPPLKGIVQAIVGDTYIVSSLVPAGATPHTYEPTPEQLRNFSDASVLVKVGTPIEFETIWLDQLLTLNREMLVIDTSIGIDFLELEEEHEEEEATEEEDEHGHEGDFDPHTWLSLQNLQVIAQTITTQLQNKHPEYAQRYEENLSNLLAQLKQLDEEIAGRFAASDRKSILVYHDAWGYFARDYSLNLIAIEQEGKEPTAQDIQQVIAQAQEEGISVIITSPEFSSLSAQVIAKEIKAEVIGISPLSENIIESFSLLVESVQL